MNQGLIVTFLVGFFILIGSIIVFKTKNNDRVVHFSISIALGVMATLGLVELLPESFTSFMEEFDVARSIILVVASALIGFGLLKVLDHFIPDHDKDDNSKKEKEENLYHIGIVSSIALVIHNVIEGMALYTSCQADFRMGLLISLGIGLHNIPLGMIITSTFYKGTHNKKKTILWLLLISLSTFVGGFGIFLLGESFMTSNVLGVLLGITLGMIVYITTCELIPHIRELKNKRDSFLGILCGILLLLVSQLF